MAGSIYMLRAFFTTGRKPNGSYLGEHEDILNATQRNLSCLTDAELLALRDSAYLLVQEIEATYQERDMDEEHEWHGHPDPTDPDNYWIDDATGARIDARTGERNGGQS